MGEMMSWLLYAQLHLLPMEWRLATIVGGAVKQALGRAHHPSARPGRKEQCQNSGADDSRSRSGSAGVGKCNARVGGGGRKGGNAAAARQGGRSPQRKAGGTTRTMKAPSARSKRGWGGGTE
eukprot:EG_transcript_11122